MTGRSLLFLITQIYSSSYTTGQYTYEITDSGNYVRVGSDIDMNATECEAYCQDVFGTHLCSIHSDSDNEDIMGDGTFYTTFGEQMYIGLNDIETEGDYVWMDETSFDYENWYNKQDTTEENCVRITETDGSWNDVSCSTGYNSFVCNYDYYDSVDYFGVNIALNYTSADLYCQTQFGTHLATVTSSKENNDTRTAATNDGVSTSDDIWIGYNDIENEGTWIWLDGTRTDLYINEYENWDDGEPNDGSTGQDCGKIRESGRWDDDRCRETKPFVCNARPRTTQAPSYNPTSLPTSGPTEMTEEPTDEPTNEPTDKPTNKPTAADDPTEYPSTPFPSISSTASTSTSTSMSSSVTKQPSRAPIEVSTTGYPRLSMSMTTIIPTSMPSSSSDTNNTVDLITSNTGLIIVIVSIVVLLWCICACACAHFKRKKTKEAIETAAANTVDRYAQYTSNQQSV